MTTFLIEGAETSLVVRHPESKYQNLLIRNGSFLGPVLKLISQYVGDLAPVVSILSQFFQLGPSISPNSNCSH
jgi:hypothetical protein